jgi:hypothetical protein
MKNRFYVGVLLAFLIGLMGISGVPLTKDAIAADPVTLEVYDPSGAFQITQLFAPRLATLHDKTICEVSDVTWEANRTFPLIADLLQKLFPTIKFVSWDQFPTGVFGIDSDKIGELVKAKGCQAAIVGNAG